MKKIVITALVLVIMAAGSACEMCGGGSKPYFDVRGFSVDQVLKADTTLTYPNQTIILTDSSAIVDACTYGIRLRADIQYHTHAQQPGTPVFPGAAFACAKTTFGDQGSKEQISDISITSNADFDAAHPAGASLSEFFAVSASGTVRYDSLYHTAIPLGTFLSRQPHAREVLYLWLTQRPEASLEHRFTVRYKQTNGEQYVLRAPNITFQ